MQGKSVTLDIKDLYPLFCKRCRRKVRDYVKEKVAEALAVKILEGRDEPIQVSAREVYSLLCKRCKKRMYEKVKERVEESIDFG